MFHYRYEKHLPIHEKWQEIIDAIGSQPVVIIAGETGSGKTTQLPFMCHEAGRGGKGAIVCTQPRRIAAVSLAHHAARLARSPVGKHIGYKVRFQEKISSATHITFVTDGILLAEIAQDPLLRAYDTIIIDEAHERTVNIDFLLGYMRTLLPRRADLKFIISSATIDTDLFSRSFNHAPVITVSGRLYPIQTYYRPIIEMWDGEAMRSYIDCVIAIVREILDTYTDGDILVFMPTTQDIQETVSDLKRITAKTDTVILPLFSRMAMAEQQRIFHAHRGRKVVIATNIAETSITVPDIRFVIDTGLARILRWEPSPGISRMPVERISRASADQRAGRCGRVRDGICIRLFSEQDYRSRPGFTSPEIKRSNLAGIILRMHHLNLGQVERFPFMQRPSQSAVSDGYRQLRMLGAINRSGALTPLGRKMALLPLDPPVACMLLYARDHTAVREVMVIASALSIVDPRPEHTGSEHASSDKVRRFTHPESDFLTFVNIWKALHAVKGILKSSASLETFCRHHGLSFHRVREWIAVHEQIKRICKTIPGFQYAAKPASYESVHKSLLCGLVNTAACRQDNGLYEGVTEHDITIFPDSTLFKKQASWVLFHEIIQTNRIYGRTVAVIHPQWIEALFPNRCSYRYEQAAFDSETGTVRALEQVLFHTLRLILNRPVDYSLKNREEAHETFIREALVEEKAGMGYRFLKHNRTIRNTIDAAERKLRQRFFQNGEQVLHTFYDNRLSRTASLRELNSAIRKHGTDAFLFVNDKELLMEPLPSAVSDYPDDLVIGSTRIPVRYTYAPDQENDGATAFVPLPLYQAVPLYYWEWLLHVFWQERIEQFAVQIKNRVKEPSLDTQRVITTLRNKLSAAPGPFTDALCSLMQDEFSVTMNPVAVSMDGIQRHLWLRVAVTDETGAVLDTFRLPYDKPSLPHPGNGKRRAFWAPYCTQWERTHMTHWDSDPFPRSVYIGPTPQQVPLCGFPALCPEKDLVSLRVFLWPQTALSAHAQGVRLLLEHMLASDLAWEIRSFQIPFMLMNQCRRFTESKDLEKNIHRLYERFVLDIPAALPFDKEAFDSLAQQCRDRLQSSKTEALTFVARVAVEYEACMLRLETMEKKFDKSFLSEAVVYLRQDLDTYLSMLFSSDVPLVLVRELPRYLKAFQYRIQTAFLNPARYRFCMESISSFQTVLKQLYYKPEADFYVYQQALLELEAMIQEYAISLFAHQNVKPKYPVSEQRLKKRFREVEKLTVQESQ